MNDSTKAPEAVQNEVTVVRVLDAPRALVWNAWIDPKQFAYWFGAELDVPQETLDWKPAAGAKWSAIMKSEDGDDMPFGGLFITIEEPTLLVISFEDVTGAGTDEGRQLLKVTFAELADDKTEITINQSGLMPEGMVDGLTHGYNAFMDYLNQLLTSQA